MKNGFHCYWYLLFCWYPVELRIARTKYIFYFIGDGMGTSHVTLAKLYADSVLNDSNAVSFTQFPVVSHSTTYAQNRYITGSAAAGTALSSGTKTSINTIGLTYDRTDTLYSIAKSLKRQVGRLPFLPVLVSTMQRLQPFTLMLVIGTTTTKLLSNCLNQTTISSPLAGFLNPTVQNRTQGQLASMSLENIMAIIYYLSYRG